MESVSALLPDPPLTPFSAPLLKLTIGAVVTNGANAFSAFAVATMLPRTAADLGGLHYYGWAFSAYMLADIVGLTLSGMESDRRGPGWPYLAGIICFTAGLLTAGLAPSMLTFIFGRAIQGFGGGLVGSAVYVTIGRAYPESAKARMLALLSSAGIVPALIGPAIAGAIADLIDWRAVFFVLLPFPLVAGWVAFPQVRAIGPGISGALPQWRRLAHAIALALGASALIAGLGTSRLVTAIPLAAIGAIVMFAMLARMMPRGTLIFAAGLPAAIAIMMLISLGYFGVDSFVPLAMTDIKDRSTSFAGLALTAAALAWTGGAWVLAHVAERTNRRSIIRLGVAMMALATAGMTATLFESMPAEPAIPLWALSGLGMGFGYAGVSLTVLQLAEQGKEGEATSSMQIGFVLGTALGAGIGDAWISALSDGVTANHTSLAGQFLLMTGFLAIAFVAIQRLPIRPHRGGANLDQAG